MNHRLIFRLAVLGAGFGQSQPGISGATAEEADRELHTIVVVGGEVDIKRRDWSRYSTAGVGTDVNRGDLIRLGANASASIVCSDLSLRVLPASRVSGVPCTAQAPALLVYEGSLLNPTRATSDATIPSIVGPRRTKLIGPRPTLRWTAVPSIARYTVRVSGPGLDWSAEVTDSTSIVYPVGAPSLSPGVTYKVSVTAGPRSSDELGEVGIGFALLDDAGVQTVRALEQRIQALRLPAATTLWLSARLYGVHELRAEAIEMLERLAPTESTPAVWSALADQYQRVGLGELAEGALLQAFREASNRADDEGQALAQRSLALLYRDFFGLPGDARAAFQQALASFQRLGATAAVGEVEHALMELEAQ